VFLFSGLTRELFHTPIRDFFIKQINDRRNRFGTIRIGCSGLSDMILHRQNRLKSLSAKRHRQLSRQGAGNRVIDLWIRYRQLFSSILQSIMRKSSEYSRYGYCRKPTDETIAHPNAYRSIDRSRVRGSASTYPNWINRHDEKTLGK